MARYLWQCKQCARQEEVERPMKDYQMPPDKCACGSELYERVIEPTKFVLNGGGWHRDEYNKRGPIK